MIELLEVMLKVTQDVECGTGRPCRQEADADWFSVALKTPPKKTITQYVDFCRRAYYVREAVWLENTELFGSNHYCSFCSLYLHSLYSIRARYGNHWIIRNWSECQ